MIVDLAANLPSSAQVELQKEMQSAFVRVLKRAAGEEKNLNRLTVRAVYLLCWIRRYQGDIFRGWKETDIPVVFKMGGCGSHIRRCAKVHRISGICPCCPRIR